MMTYVKMRTEDWALQLFAQLTSLFDPDKMPDIVNNPHAQLIKQYVAWAKKYYDDRVVPTAADLADCYYDNSIAYFREEEDNYLINDAKRRTEPMSDDEWQAYCEGNDAIVITNEYALLTDGYFDRKEKR
jgi:hypothetical protein